MSEPMAFNLGADFKSQPVDANVGGLSLASSKMYNDILAIQDIKVAFESRAQTVAAIAPGAGAAGLLRINRGF